MHDQRPPKVWWVTQSKTYEWSRTDGILWATIHDRRGRPVLHRQMLSEVRSGDVIVAYTWNRVRAIGRATNDAVKCTRPSDMRFASSKLAEGFLVEVEYLELDTDIRLSKVRTRLHSLSINQGPLDVRGVPKQGYIFRFNAVGLRILRQATNAAWTDWAEIPNDNEVYGRPA